MSVLKKDDDISDDQIISAVNAGDYEAFSSLVIRYQNMVFALIMRQVADRELAHDLSQEVFVKAYKGLRGFKSQAAFSTWLSRIAINHTHSYFSSKKYKQKTKTSTLNPEIHAQASTTDEALEKEQQLLKLRTFVAQLSPTYREAIVLCSFEGKSYEQAALILKIPVGTVRSRLNRARALLKEAFNKEQQRRVER